MHFYLMNIIFAIKTDINAYGILFVQASIADITRFSLV